MAKNIMIFGDSYSTFEGYIPEGYACHYYLDARNDTDVVQVSQTWWHQLAAELGLNLVQNNSWSGSTISYTGYNNTDCSQTSSFICRLNKLIGEDFFGKNAVDTVFVFGGTNDNWANVPLGELQYDHFEHEDLFSVLPAISFFFKTLKAALPEAKIYCLVNTELKPEIAEGFHQVCDHYGIVEIAFEHIDKRSGHPTIQGMKDIKNKIKEAIQ